MKARILGWTVGVLVAAVALGCANSRGMKLPLASAVAGPDGGSRPPEQSTAGTQGAAGAGGAASGAVAGMQSGPLPSGDVSVGNAPEPSVDAGMQNAPQTGVDAGMQNAPDSGPTGALMLTFTTATSGRYAPHNAGVAWIETASGTFVKTLERWANIEARMLTRWTMASGGWGSFFGMTNTQDMMDAISRATLRQHETHELTWNLKDAQGNVVPDGAYRVVIEVVDSNDGSISSEVAFEKGREPLTVMPPDTPPFVGFTLNYEP